MFPAWGFALAVLAWVVWRRMRPATGAAAAARAAGALGLAVLVGFGLAATTVTALAPPWQQLSRLADRSERPDTFGLGAIEAFVAANADDDEPVLFIGQNGHLIARDAGVRNVSRIGDPSTWSPRNRSRTSSRRWRPRVVMSCSRSTAPTPRSGCARESPSIWPSAATGRSPSSPTAAGRLAPGGPGARRRLVCAAVKHARNIAIIALLALIVAAVPGGGNAEDAILATISIVFFALIGFAGYQLYRQNRLAYLGLTDGQRAAFVGALGAIVLMIAGAAELTETGAGLMVWLAVIGFAVFTLVKVWGDARRSY